MQEVRGCGVNMRKLEFVAAEPIVIAECVLIKDGDNPSDEFNEADCCFCGREVWATVTALTAFLLTHPKVHLACSECAFMIEAQAKAYLN